MARVSTPKPGQIRCPTCHESTPPGAFCTRCGQPIPASALARPRGLDRQELEDRLRGRRAGDTPYRRGSPADEGAAGGSAFDRFEPEPEDALAKRDLPPGASAAPRVDNFSAAGEAAAAASAAPARAGDVPGPPSPRWPREAPFHSGSSEVASQGDTSTDLDASNAVAGSSAQVQAQPDEGERGYRQDARAQAGPASHDPSGAADDDRNAEAVYPPGDEADDAYYDYGSDYGYDAAAPYDTEERGTGGPWLIVGIIGLGLVALLGGVLLSGLFGRSPGVASATATPTIAAQASPTPGVSPVGESPTPGSSAQATQGPPGTFPDGFTASVQPCATQKRSKDGLCRGWQHAERYDRLWLGRIHEWQGERRARLHLGRRRYR